MRERERVALVEVRLDVFAVDARLLGVGQQHHDHVGFLARLRGRDDTQAGLLGLRPRRRPLAQADAHVDAGVLQVQRVRVALRAVTEHGDLAPLEQGEVGVVVVVDRCGHVSSLLVIRSFSAAQGTCASDVHSLAGAPPSA